MAKLTRRTKMTNYAELAAEMNNVTNAKIELETFINESDRGDRKTITIINSNDGRGTWTLDIIKLNSFGKDGKYSVLYDNDMDVTTCDCGTDKELQELFERLADAADTVLSTFADQED
jgi:hypothetical protein